MQVSALVVDTAQKRAAPPVTQVSSVTHSSLTCDTTLQSFMANNAYVVNHTDTDSTDSEAASHGSPFVKEPEEDNMEDNRVAVLRACLRHVRGGGWSASVLAEGVKEAGLQEGEERELFPNGPGDLVNMFEQECNKFLYRYMEKQKKAG